MSGRFGKAGWAVYVGALVAVLLASQAMALSIAPASNRASTAKTIGQTGFAFLGGLRTFAAAVVLNRLDPIHDTYFGHAGSIKDETYLLPSLRLVTMLEPTFEAPYYNVAYILAARGNPTEGLRVAREGLRNNPRSGLMHANVVQVLLIEDKKKNLPEMVRIASAGLHEDVYWATADDQFEGYAVFRAIFKLAGNQQMVDELTEAGERIRASGKLSVVDHDHDGDGEQDH